MRRTPEPVAIQVYTRSICHQGSWREIIYQRFCIWIKGIGGWGPVGACGRVLRDDGIHLHFGFRLQFWETLERLSSLIVKRSMVMLFVYALGWALKALGWASMRTSTRGWVRQTGGWVSRRGRQQVSTSAVGHTSAIRVKEHLNSRHMRNASRVRTPKPSTHKCFYSLHTNASTVRTQMAQQISNAT